MLILTLCLWVGASISSLNAMMAKVTAEDHQATRLTLLSVYVVETGIPPDVV